jgi:hypothetical protein
MNCMRLSPSRGLLLAVLVLFSSAPAYAQLAPFAPYASCAESSVPDCLDSRKNALLKYYRSQIDIIEEKARRLRYYDLLTNSAIDFVVNARLAAEQETEKAAGMKDSAVRQRHLAKAKREQRWADDAAKKLLGGTPETHREQRKIGRDALEAKFDEDLRVFQEYLAERLQ